MVVQQHFVLILESMRVEKGDAGWLTVPIFVGTDLYRAQLHSSTS